jgi:hypothetical protein
MHTDAVDAYRQVRDVPQLGRFIARVHLPANDPSVVVPRWGGSGHRTIWCDPAKCLDSVSDVFPIAAFSVPWWSDAMRYELCDVETGNLGRYPTEAAALSSVGDDIHLHGLDVVTGLSPSRHSRSAKGGVIAQGSDLATLAMNAAGARERIPA